MKRYQIGVGGAVGLGEQQGLQLGDPGIAPRSTPQPCSFLLLSTRTNGTSPRNNDHIIIMTKVIITI